MRIQFKTVNAFNKYPKVKNNTVFSKRQTQQADSIQDCVQTPKKLGYLHIGYNVPNACLEITSPEMNIYSYAKPRKLYVQSGCTTGGKPECTGYHYAQYNVHRLQHEAAKDNMDIFKMEDGTFRHSLSPEQLKDMLQRAKKLDNKIETSNIPQSVRDTAGSGMQDLNELIGYLQKELQ